MILVIAEKPSVAQSIAKVLGASVRKDGYLEGGGYLVSWCVGHLVGLADAGSYDARYAKWRYEDLPIVPDEWLFEVPKAKEKQFNILSSLMRDNRVKELVCATGLSKEDIVIAASAVKEPEYIDREDYTGLELRLEDDKEEVINQILLEKLLGELKENERKLIEMRYYQEKTQTEVAKMLGMSQVQVSRNEKKILAKLRNLYCS